MSTVIRSGPVRYAHAGRFAPPEPSDPRSPEPTDATVCPQRPSRLEHVMGAPHETHPQGEDCLALSVVAPAEPGPHPVLVFLHGGAFTSGSGLMSSYDGGALAAEQGVVVVSVSYRLGPFGWLALDGVSPGNLGLLDQAAALRWVHEGIGRFGGDPDRVTVAGQSAGAASVALLLQMPATRTLLRRAIVQSAPPLNAFPDGQPENAERLGRRFAELLDADPTGAPAEALVDAGARLAREERERRPDALLPPWAPVFGFEPVPAASVLPTDPASLEVLVGWNRDELTAFGADLADAPAPSQQGFIDPWLPDAARLREAGAGVRGYRLDWRPPGSPFGATHCLELPLLLGDEAAWRGSPMLGETGWDEVDRMGAQLRAAWAGFVRTGRVDPALTPDVPVAWAPTGDLDSLRVG